MTTIHQRNKPTTTTGITTRDQQKNFIVLPYIQGLGEKFKKMCNKQGKQVHFKGTNTVKQLLIAPKDRDPKVTKSGIIYRYRCPHINCTEQYIGESGRTLGDRASQGTLTHTPTHIHLRTPNQPRMFFHIGQGGTWIDWEHQGSHVHQGEWPLPKQELGKIPATTNMGSGTKGHTFTAPQVTSAPPVLSHPPTCTLPQSPTPTLHKGGGTNLFLGKFLGTYAHGGVTVTPLHPNIPP